MRVYLHSFIVAIAIGLMSALAHADEFDFPKIDIMIGDKTLQVEYANTFALRAQGLQFRQEMCPDCGMLFKFDRVRMASMWMKNTLLPLDVAFIDEDGNIVNIEAMQPLDLTSISSAGPVRYALEMNQGWFEANKFKVGDQLTNLP